MKLRILHVIPSLATSTGGPAQAVLGMARASISQGHQVAIWSTDLAGRAQGWGMPQRGGAAHVAITRTLRAEGIDARAYPILWPARYGYAPGLGRALRRDVAASDLVHLHSLYLYSTWAASQACIAAGVPYILRPHGILTAYQARQRSGLKRLYNRALGQAAIDGAASIHYTTEQERMEAEAGGIVRPGKVLRLGVDLATFAQLPPRGGFRARYPALGERPLILFLSRLAPKKGLDLLVPAFARLREDLPRAQLVIAGPDDTGYGATVRGMVRDAGLDAHVTFTGMIVGQEKMQALRDADIWVLPSYDENFGIAAVEAMAAGLPIILSDQVDIYPEVKRADAGVVVPCAVEPLAAAMWDLLHDGARRAQLGVRARELALGYYAWDAVAPELVEYYREVIDAVRCR